MHDQPTYDPNIVRALKKSIRLIDPLIEVNLRDYHVARTQYRVMYYVAHNPEITQSALLKLMELQAPTLTTIIDSLVKKRIIERKKTNSDKRINNLVLTAEGLRTFQQIPDPAILIDTRIREKLGDSLIDNLVSSLNEVNTLLG